MSENVESLDDVNLSESEIETSTTVKTSDGITFTIQTEDVIDLTEEQFNTLTATVLRRKAEYIRKDGVDIASLTQEQINIILNEIQNRIDGSTDPLGDDLIRISEHIQDDHAVNPEELRRRGWYRDHIQEIYDDIVNVIRQSQNVRKAKMKFLPHSEASYPKFTFTLMGVKVNGDKGEVSIAFIEDPNDFVLAVTII